MTESTPVLVERRESVALITLNRPDARNSVNSELASSLAKALEDLDSDPELAAGVLTGAGRGFSAGMDLKAFAEGSMPTVDGRGFAGIVEQSCRKPLVAAVEGFALAGGLEIALSCDLIVASKGTRLGIPEVTVGLFAGAGALLRLPRQLSYAVAMEMALTGDPILAERAYELGMINRLVEPGHAVEAAMELAERIARNAPLALAASKQILAETSGMDDQSFWNHQRPLFQQVFTSNDAFEGARAFAEKRAAQWQGN